MYDQVNRVEVARILDGQIIESVDVKLEKTHTFEELKEFERPNVGIEWLLYTGALERFVCK